MRHDVIAGLVLSGLLSGCPSSPVEPPDLDAGFADDLVCDEDLWGLEWDDEGLPPPGSPPVWVDPVDIPFERGAGTGTVVHFWLPWDLNARQAYYLRDGEDVHVRLRIMQGTEEPAEGVFKLWAFVEGRLVQVRQDGRMTSIVSAVVEDGLAETDFQMPAEVFQRGLNAVHLYHYVEREVTGFDWIDGGAWPLTVARETTDAPAAVEPTPGYIVEDARPGFASVAWWIPDGSDGEEPFVRIPDGPLWEGESVSLVLRAQADPREHPCFAASDVSQFAIVALLDGVPHPLGEHERIVARVPQGEQHIFRFELSLPVDDESHELRILSLPGLGLPARLSPGGYLPPWSVSLPPVSVVRYGPRT